MQRSFVKTVWQAPDFFVGVLMTAIGTGPLASDDVSARLRHFLDPYATGSGSGLLAGLFWPGVVVILVALARAARAHFKSRTRAPEARQT